MKLNHRFPKLTKKRFKKVLRLVEQITRAEICARHLPLGSLEFGDYAMAKLEKEAKLRKYVFGNSSLVKLGTEWGIIKPNRKKK